MPRHFLVAAYLAASLSAVTVAEVEPLRGQASPNSATPAGPCSSVVDEQGAARSERITWVLRLGERERRRLDEQCRTVGPIVLRALPQRPPIRGIVNSVVVVGWNVHVGGGDILTLVRRLESGGLTGQPIAHYILLLQEAYRTDAAIPHIAPGIRVPGRIAPRTGDRAREDILNVARTLNLALY